MRCLKDEKHTVSPCAAAGNNAGATGRSQTEFRGEGLHDFQVLLGNGDLRHLLDIPGRRFEDGAVLGNEILGLAPPGICLAVPGEGGQVGHGQHAHGCWPGSTPMAAYRPLARRSGRSSCG